MRLSGRKINESLPLNRKADFCYDNEYTKPHPASMRIAERTILEHPLGHRPMQKPQAHWIALLLGVLAFALYGPSLGSDFVYDSRIEIYQEGFINHLAYLPDVLTLKVLTMPLMLGDRPGQILFMMMLYSTTGPHPFLFHFASNLLHAANVALLFLFLWHLIKAENVDWRP